MKAAQESQFARCGIMKKFLILLFGPLCAVTLWASEMPAPEVPATGAVVYAPHPHFRWKREPDVKIDEVHRIQIARDAAFADVVCDDYLEVVSRFVPVKPLEPGKYWWRVRRGEREWSAAVPFEVRAPQHTVDVRLGTDPATVARIIQEAAAHTPARVDFEPGEYTFTPEEERTSLITLDKVSDLIIDGHGAKLVLGGTFLSLKDCRRVTLQNVTVTANRPGHTLVRVIKKETEKGRLVVKPEPGYDPDIPYHFRSGNGFGGSFLGCMDTNHPGREITGALVSVRWAKVEPSAEEPNAFVFSPVPRETLDRFPIGAPAMITAYRWRWVDIFRGEEITFSNVAAVDLPGAFSGGSSSAKSYLSCKVQRRSPKDYYGGHSATGGGRIGEWIENCEFEYLPDDGPAEQSFRNVITGTSGKDSVLLGGSIENSPVQPGDRVSLVDLKGLRGACAQVVKVAQSGKSLVIQLNRPLNALAQVLGGTVAAEGKNIFLYVDAPSNEDFVYRHNRHFGGKGHGVKFNGTRGWIADSTFENINGNAIMAGYISAVSGHGAADLVISGNAIVRCGWTPICSTSESRLASNLIIRDNTVRETRDAAIAIIGYNGVTVTGNTFSSSTVPALGAWVIFQDSTNIDCRANRFPGGLPESRTAEREWDNNRPYF